MSDLPNRVTVLNFKCPVTFNIDTDDIYISNCKLWLVREGCDALVELQDLTEVLEEGKIYEYDHKTGNVYFYPERET